MNSPEQTADNPRRALIIMAHGSRRASANEEFFALVDTIDRASERYQVVRPALLEQAPPTLLECGRSLPADISHIDVYPLFFNCGRHVEKDIPAQVAELMEALPEKNITLLDYFGQSKGLATLVLDHIGSQQAGA